MVISRPGKNLEKISKVFAKLCKFVVLICSFIENAEGYVLMAVFLFICMCACLRVIRISQKVLNRIA